MMKKKLLCYILLTVCCFALWNCSQSAMFPDKRLMESNPDSAYRVLSRVDLRSLADKPARQARYAMLTAQAAEESGNPMPNDTLISTAIEYYGNLLWDSDNTVYKACYYKALLCIENRQYSEASALLVAAEQSKNALLLGKVYNRQGYVMLQQENNSNGRAELLQSIAYFRKARYLKGENDALLLLAYTYTAVADYDSALVMLRQAHRQSHDSVFTGRVLQETGRMYHTAGSFDSAEIYLKNSLRYPMVKYQQAIRNELLAEIYLETARYDSAKLFAQEALQHLAPPEIKQDCYSVLVNVAIIQNTDDDSLYFNKYLEYTDTINETLRQPRFQVMQDMHDIKTSSERRRMLILIISAIGLIIIIGYNLVINKMQKKRKEQNSALKETQKIFYRQLNEDILQIERRIVKKQKKEIAQSELEKQYRDMLVKRLRLKNTATFFEYVSAALNNLPQKLHSQYPDVTEQDIVLCCLINLKINDSQIGIITESNETAVKKRKQRLAKKLKLAGVKELKKILDNLINRF